MKMPSQMDVALWYYKFVDGMVISGWYEVESINHEQEEITTTVKFKAGMFL